MDMQQKNPYKRGGLFEAALPTVFENAKLLRRNMTQAETVLWMHLREGVSGCKFRRQHPIGMYIADFYCHQSKLVIEVDGSIHNIEAVKENDLEKNTYFGDKGFSVLRFSNEDVMRDIENVLQKITTIVNINIHQHSPSNGG